MGIDTTRGFVAVPRGLTDWEWYTEPNTARLFIHLLLTANWQEKQWRGVTIRPGQLVTSQARLAKQLHLSVRNIRTALDHLQVTGWVTVKAGSKYSIVTINNYFDIVGTDRQPAGDRQQLNHYDKENKTVVSACGSGARDDDPTVEELFEACICPLSAYGKAQLAGYADKLGQELVGTIIRKCADLGGSSWAYVRKALDEAQAQGCKSVEEYRRTNPIGAGRYRRVDRAAPSGNDFLRDAARRRPLKKKGGQAP